MHGQGGEARLRRDDDESAWPASILVVAMLGALLLIYLPAPPSSIQVAHAIVEEVHPCNGGLAPPQLANTSTWEPIFVGTGLLGVVVQALTPGDWWNVNTVSASSLALNASAIVVKGFYLNATSTATHPSSADLVVTVSSLVVTRDAAALTGSLTDYSLQLTVSDGNQTATVVQDGSTTFGWACVEASSSG